MTIPALFDLRTPIGACVDPHPRCADCGADLRPLHTPGGIHCCHNPNKTWGYGPRDHVLIDATTRARVIGPFRRGPAGVEVLISIGWHETWVPASRITPHPAITPTTLDGASQE